MTTTAPTATTDPTTAMLRQRYSAAYQAGVDSVANTTMSDDEVRRMLAAALSSLAAGNGTPSSAAFWLGSLETREALAR